MTLINTNEFSINLQKYLKMALSEQVYVQNGRNRFHIVKVNNNETKKDYIPKVSEIIDRGLKNIQEGKTKRYTIEELQFKMGL